MNLLEDDMKKIALAAAFATIGTAAMAGTLAAPIVEPTIAPEIIVEHTRAAAGGIIVPILLLVAAAVVLR
jgi:hypothetical protein